MVYSIQENETNYYKEIYCKTVCQILMNSVFNRLEVPSITLLGVKTGFPGCN